MLSEAELNKVISIIEQKDIRVDFDDKYLECETWCNYGMNFLFYIDTSECENIKDVADNVAVQYENYDVDEEVRLRLEMPGAPGIRLILKDCEEAEQLLDDLADALYKKSLANG